MRKSNPNTVHAPAGYTHLVEVGNLVFLSGQVGRNAAGEIVGAGDPGAQTEQIFKNIEACLRDAGCTLDDIIKVTIFITDYSYKEAVLKVRDKYLGANPPASTFVVCSSLALPEYLVEIECIAEKK